MGQKSKSTNCTGLKFSILYTHNKMMGYKLNIFLNNLRWNYPSFRKPFPRLCENDDTKVQKILACVASNLSNLLHTTISAKQIQK